MADSESALSRRVTVDSLTLPGPADLLAARALIPSHEGLRGAFLAAREGGWGAEQLATALVAHLGEDQGEVARYLADEFLQVGDRILLISTETGLCIGAVTEDDLWQPEAVPREDGTLIRPLPRLRPELEGYLAHQMAEAHRERDLETRLAARLPETPLVRWEGDRRLAMASRQGRASLVGMMREEAPQWWSHLGGSARAFVEAIQLGPLPPGRVAHRALLVARVRRGIQDIEAVNLRYDPAAAMGPALGQGLLGDLARVLGVAVQGHEPVGPEDGADLWLCPPGYLWALAGPGRSVFVVDGLKRPLAIRTAGRPILVDPVSPWRVVDRELFDRWEIRAEVEVLVSYDPGVVRPVAMAEIVETPQVEIVRLAIDGPRGSMATISAITTTGERGEPVSIDGTGFGASQGQSQLLFYPSAGSDLQVASVTSWSATEIVSEVPLTAPLGPGAYFLVQVATEGGIGHKTDTFTVLSEPRPVLTELPQDTLVILQPGTQGEPT